jgi:hypothetical protein
MMQIRQRTLSMRLLVLLALAFATASRADESAAAGGAPAANAVAPDATKPDAPAPDAATVKPDARGADKPKARAQRQPTGRKPGQGIDESVRRLTRALDLDPEQQARLRQILVDQQRQAQGLRNERSQPGADQAGLTLAVLERTKERIRAMLNEEQRKKYSADVPREMTAPANADLQHWMQMQESKKMQHGDKSN